MVDLVEEVFAARAQARRTTVYGDPNFSPTARAHANGHSPEPEVKGTSRRKRKAADGTPTQWSYSKLMRESFPDLRWRLDGLIPDAGLVFLGGKKKLGKSYMALQWAWAVGSGRETFDRPVLQSNTLYLALEDGARRTQRRLKEQGAPVKGVSIVFQYQLEDPLDDDLGKQAFLDLIDDRKYKLIIIDTLARLKTGKTRENEAGGMADLVHWLQQTASEKQIAILVVAHHGKHTTGDPGDDLRGTSAIGGAGDLNIGLYYDEGEFLLKGEGRDIDSFELRLAREPESKTWRVLGDHTELQFADDLSVLKGNLGSDWFDFSNVAEALEVSGPTARKKARQLESLGYLESRTDKRGKTKVVQWRFKRLPRKEGNMFVVDPEEGE